MTPHPVSRAGRALAAALLAAALLTVGGAAGVGAAPGPPADRRILVVGDSVLLGARDAILSRLGAAGYDVHVDAEVSRSTLGGLDVLRRERAGIGDVVIVHLGHNDGASPAVFRARIDAVMGELRDVDRVIWCNLAEFRGWVPAANAELAAAATRWPNLEIADWRSVAASDPAHLYSDGIHLPPPGREALAALVAERVEAWATTRRPSVAVTRPFGRAPALAARHDGPVLAAALAAVATTPGGRGAWTVGADGAVHAHGSARLHGSFALVDIPDPVVGIAATPDGEGYWLADARGRMSAFGSALSYGDAVKTALLAPVAGIAATASGGGYWLAAADGGVFAFGDAPFEGALPGWFETPVAAIAGSPDGRGYWVVSRGGQVAAFGSARSYGDLWGSHLAAPVVSVTPTASGRGYWLVAADGGVFAFADAPFRGSASGSAAGDRFVGLVPSSDGYTLMGSRSAE